jgi:hypothetical protein
MQAQRLSIATTSLLLVILLAGCFEDGSQGGSESTTSTTPPSPCRGLACLANLDSHDASYVKATYGLRQISNDSRPEQAMSVEGDWVIWNLNRIDNETGWSNDPLFAYNMRTGELIAVADELASNIVLPRLNQDRVLYYRDSSDDARGMYLWDTRTRATARLQFILEGEAEPDSFDGDWVVVRNRGSSNDSENAWWAWNLKDDRLVYLYKPLPENRRPDGSYETLTFTAIDEGVAYYPLTFADPTSKHFNATLVAVDLTTGERREYRLQGNSLYRLSVNDGFAVSDPGRDIVALNLTNGTFWFVNGPDELGCGFPTTAKGVVSFTCAKVPGGDNEFKAILVNLTSGQRTRLILQNLPIFEAATDGSTWLLEASRGAHRPSDVERVAEVYDFYYTDLYWRTVS